MIQFLRGTKSVLEDSSNVPAEGQPIYVTDTGLLKIGNGIDVFDDLPYQGVFAEQVHTTTSSIHWVNWINSHRRLTFGHQYIDLSRLNFQQLTNPGPTGLSYYAARFDSTNVLYNDTSIGAIVNDIWVTINNCKGADTDYAYQIFTAGTPSMSTSLSVQIGYWGTTDTPPDSNVCINYIVDSTHTGSGDY